MNALVIVLADLFIIGIASGLSVNKSIIVRICLFPLLGSVKSITKSIAILSKGLSGISILCSGYDWTHAFS